MNSLTENSGSIKSKLAVLVDQVDANRAAKRGHDPLLEREIIAEVNRLTKADLQDGDKDALQRIDELCKLGVLLVPSGKPRALPVKKLSDLKERAINWLWRNRIAEGKLTILDADPGMGKSLITCDLAARLTTGKPLPGERHARPPGNVLFIAPEDDAEDTILPRLRVSGADIDRIWIIDSTASVPDERDKTGQSTRFLSLPEDIEIIKDIVITNDIKLIVVDPIISLMVDLNPNRDNDVRKGIMPLVALAQETGVSILNIRHMTKDKTKAASSLGAGSVGWVATHRVGLLLARDPEEEGSLVLAVHKTNVGKMVSTKLRLITGAEGQHPTVTWLGDSLMSADELMQRQGEAMVTKPQIDRAEDFLTRMLKDGPQAVKTLQDAADAEGISWTTVKRARQRLNIETAGRKRAEWKLVTTANLAPLAPRQSTGEDERDEDDLPAF